MEQRSCSPLLRQEFWSLDAQQKDFQDLLPPAQAMTLGSPLQMFEQEELLVRKTAVSSMQQPGQEFPDPQHQALKK